MLVKLYAAMRASTVLPSGKDRVGLMECEEGFASIGGMNA
jgi:hypothetical protein